MFVLGGCSKLKIQLFWPNSLDETCFIPMGYKKYNCSHELNIIHIFGLLNLYYGDLRKCIK